MASLLLLCPASAHAQGGVPLWTNRYDGGYDSASAIAMDSSGNVFVTGYSSNGTNSDFATIAYSNSGVSLWTNRYNGPANGYDGARGVAVDSSGNVFATGPSWNGSTHDCATVAYSNSGVPLWTNVHDGNANNGHVGRAIAVDGSGNVFVMGNSVNSASPYNDYATIKYSGAGDPLWINFYDGPVNATEQANAMAVDSSGNVFVTGISQYDISGYSDCATVAYSGAGDLLWENRYNAGSASSYGWAIAVDSNGNVFVAGESWNGISLDFVTIAYSNSGVPRWTNRYNGPRNGGDSARAIAVDLSGNVFVTGHSYDGNGGNSDYATIKYSNAGVLLWARRYGELANSDDYAWAIAVDGSGNVIVAGNSSENINPSTGTTVAYSNAGVPLWTNRFNGGLGPMAVDRNGNVFVTGYSSGTNNDYLTIKYSSSVPPPRLDFQQLNYQLVLSWTNAGFNLQTAPALTGPFTNLPIATSPYTNPLTAPQQFFRLIGN